MTTAAPIFTTLALFALFGLFFSAAVAFSLYRMWKRFQNMKKRIASDPVLMAEIRRRAEASGNGLPAAGEQKIKFTPDPSLSTVKISDFHFRFNWRDSSLWSLVVSNLLTIGYVLFAHFPFAEVMLMYWFQSIIIGVFGVVDVLRSKYLPGKNKYSDDPKLPATLGERIFAACFFVFHYGFFHFGYLVFIQKQLFPMSLDQAIIPIIPAIGIFFCNHLYSYLRNLKPIISKTVSPMLAVYGRIIPMHVVIATGAALGSLAVVQFMALKTVVDVLGHVFKHRPDSQAAADSDPAKAT